MNISGVIVRTRPEQHGDVRDRLLAIPGVQLHLEGGGGRMVLTVEDGAGWSTEESLLKVHQVEGVVSASLVYQFNDDRVNSAEALS
jgi:nitrate reductase NapD